MLLATVSCAGIAGGGLADAKIPTQQQLTELIEGNTMQGVWADKPYVQYFAPSGATQYREENSPVTEGRWRVNERGQYCSVWPPSERWVCYDVLVAGNRIYWKSGDDLYPAEVKPGRRF